MNVEQIELVTTEMMNTLLVLIGVVAVIGCVIALMRARGGDNNGALRLVTIVLLGGFVGLNAGLIFFGRVDWIVRIGLSAIALFFLAVAVFKKPSIEACSEDTADGTKPR